MRQLDGTAAAYGGAQPTGGTALPTRTGAVTAVTVTVASSGHAVTGLLTRVTVVTGNLNLLLTR